MIRWLIYAMVYLGSALMVYNILGFIRFARYIRGMKTWSQGNRILYLPIVLLVCFLLGYLMVDRRHMALDYISLGAYYLGQFLLALGVVFGSYFL